MRKDLKKWISERQINLKKVTDKIFSIEGVGKFLLLEPKEIEIELPNDEGKETISAILDRESFGLILSEEEEQLFSDYECSFYLFSFGGIFYYSERVEDIDFDQFRYLGQAKRQIDQDFCNLGVHGGYELLNGSRTYSDWVDKAKFLGISSLGICEKNTLAGVLDFQMRCLDEDIKPIIGETVTVKNSEEQYEVKLYVKNTEGWRNLLKINKQINTINPQQYILEDELMNFGSGLICVLSTLVPLKKTFLSKFKKAFDQVFFQIDSVEYFTDDADKRVLAAYKLYFNNYLDVVDPVLLNDCYYLEKSDSKIKKMMNNFRSTSTFEYLSDNQFFKDLQHSFSLSEIFNEDKEFKGQNFFQLFDTMIQNTLVISESCDFKISTEGFKLPNFEFNGLDEEYSEFVKAGDEEGLFWYLIEKGFKRRVTDRGIVGEEAELYRERIRIEFEVINKGGFIGYFLILWDIVEFCTKNDILTGLGRGSAGGSLVSYLLDITKIDPIKYKLLFERFLNEGRIKVTLPDVDEDFESDRREEVKRYMEEKYGIDHVASIGSYNTFKVKSAFQDLSRVFGIPPSQADALSKIIDDDFNGRWTTSDGKFYFKTACSRPEFYEFMQNNPDLINSTFLILEQASSASIHPCATIISPKKDAEGNDMTIYDWMPLRKDKSTGILVTEWTGDVLAEIGFLKEDILGLRQLNKFREIFKLVKAHTGIKLTYDDIILDEPEVMDLFKKGISQDIFQFGTQTLISYTTKVQPDNVEELIAINAIFRPGPIDSGAHDDYVDIKFGRKEPEYDRHLEETTKNTFGLYVYQEQVMAAASILGDFNLTEADDVRRAMGKMKASAMEPYKIRFIDGAIQKDYTKEEALALWDKLLRFSSYGYNRSHAAAYAITAYFCMWLKYHYPLEFYTVSLTFADDDDVNSIISEISQLGKIQISPPDVNFSTERFIPSPSKQTIFWALNKIKFVGDVATNCIMEEREKNGEYFSLEEFIKRVDTSKVNSRVIVNLILAGAFDLVENIKIVTERYQILEKYHSLTKKKLSEEDYSRELISKEYFWRLKQKEITGLGDIDFQKIHRTSELKGIELINENKFYSRKFDAKKTFVIAGILSQVIERKAKNNADNKFASLMVNVNNTEIFITVWSDTWTKYKETLNQYKGGIILISGSCKFDDFKGKNAMYSNQGTKIIFI